jgi:hypothetical protein
MDKERERAVDLRRKRKKIIVKKISFWTMMGVPKVLECVLAKHFTVRRKQKNVYQENTAVKL